MEDKVEGDENSNSKRKAISGIISQFLDYTLEALDIILVQSDGDRLAELTLLSEIDGMGGSTDL